MRVSSILRLIMQKLDLASDDKVEISCHDKTICPSTTLHGLLERWLSRKPTDEVHRPVGAPANEFVMELSDSSFKPNKILANLTHQPNKKWLSLTRWLRIPITTLACPFNQTHP